MASGPTRRTQVNTTMERRKFLIGAGSLAAGGAAALGSGAFTSVKADRTVTVSTAPDSNALLRFEATESNENSAYAEVSGGTVEVDLDTPDVGGAGVNQNATTRIFDIFTIQNQGTQPAAVYAQPGPLKEDDAFDDSVGNIYFDPQFSDMPNDGASNLGTLSDGETKYGSLTGIGGSVEEFETDVLENNSEVPYNGGEAFVLGSGESFDFGVYIRTTGAVDSANFDVTIEADAALAEQILNNA